MGKRAGRLQAIMREMAGREGRCSIVLSKGLALVHYEGEEAFRVGREGVAPGAREVEVIRDAMLWLWGEEGSVLVGEVEDVKEWKAVRLEWIGQGVLFDGE